jgi:6-phosphogluconolactonase
MTRLTTCPDPETVAVRATAHLLREIERARTQRGVAHVALSGGTTPARMFELMAAEPTADWTGVEFWFADERCVGPQDERSNYRQAAEKLFEPAQIATERVHRMEGELGPQEGAHRYAQELERSMTGTDDAVVPVFDVVALGIGPDGHVASLFPGAGSLDAGEEAVCLGIEDSPKPPPQRITLSLAVLHAARGCLLTASGASKADAVNAMLGDPSNHVPASLLRRERLTVIVDDAAAPDGPFV